ncbi:histidinol-phosphate aminotransferase [Halpernia humi]|uniref:Histidinol-phosphate aminotransferase n=1 Tax=Halpernia humi TaxID=493375 RepID=A0A1H6ACW7_9FLAO|nr:histidinol-phosphate transaminase [Halpernia humi]SEG46573.1 histidinol-phosphate aminotransferase [Halpernia humi]
MEFNLNNLIRENIKNLVPYSSARDEFSAEEGVFLDANENPFGDYNRYPDPYQKKLKAKISEFKNIKSEQIFLGNGSDEVIDLLLRIFAEPKKDKILVFNPTYGMYQVSASINDVEVLDFPLNKEFQIDFNEDLENILEDKNLKLVFICSPNNPSGNLIKGETIEKILNNFKGIVVVDEAYEDFSTEISWLNKIKNYPNLVVMQTFSKAWGMAGLRVGMAFAQEEIMALMNKVKPPYNISILNQNEVLKELNQTEKFSLRLKEIIDQRNFLEKELQNFSFVKKIFPSNANFLLVEVEDANSLYQYLVNQKIIIRNRNSVVRNAVRITIGSEVENKTLLDYLQKFEN